MYQRLNDRCDECYKLYDKTNNMEYLMEFDCILHIFEGLSGEVYEKIAEFAKEKGFKKIIDIGCAYGHQSEIFKEYNLNYLGVEAGISKTPNYWNSDKFKYITKAYPFHIEAEERDLPVSVLCLTWNCYLYEKEKTLVEQLEQLSKDFSSCLLYLSKDKVDFVLKYFKDFEIISEDLIYFTN